MLKYVDICCGICCGSGICCEGKHVVRGKTKSKFGVSPVSSPVNRLADTDLTCRWSRQITMQCPKISSQNKKGEGMAGIHRLSPSPGLDVLPGLRDPELPQEVSAADLDGHVPVRQVLGGRAALSLLRPFVAQCLPQPGVASSAPSTAADVEFESTGTHF